MINTQWFTMSINANKIQEQSFEFTDITYDTSLMAQVTLNTCGLVKNYLMPVGSSVGLCYGNIFLTAINAASRLCMLRQVDPTHHNYSKIKAVTLTGIVLDIVTVTAIGNLAMVGIVPAKVVGLTCLGLAGLKAMAKLMPYTNPLKKI